MTSHLTSRMQLRALGLRALRKLAVQHGVPVRAGGAPVPKWHLVEALARKLVHVGRDGAWKPGDVPAGWGHRGAAPRGRGEAEMTLREYETEVGMLERGDLGDRGDATYAGFVARCLELGAAGHPESRGWHEGDVMPAGMRERALGLARRARAVQAREAAGV